MYTFALATIQAFLLSTPSASAAAGSLEGHPLPVAAEAGSVGPNLSKSPDGAIVLSWQEPEGEATRLRYSRLGSTGWSEPQTVATGAKWFVNWADFPSVLALSGGFWAAHWLDKRPGGPYAYDVAVALSADGGQSWGEAITPHTDNTLSEHGFVTLYPAGSGVGLVWLDGRNTVNVDPSPAGGEASGEAHEGSHGPGGMTLRHARLAPDGSISEAAELDGLVCDCCQTGVALARRGPVVVYRNRTEDEIRDIYLARHIDGAWQPGHPVHADGWKIGGCPVNGPAVAAQGDTVAVAWFTMAEEIPRVRFARSEDGGESFGAPMDLSENTPLGRVDLVLLDNGAAAVSWLDQDESQSGVLRLQLIAADGQSGPVFTVAQMGTGRPSGFPQMQADGKDLILAWTAAGEAGPTVQSSRIRLPAMRPAGMD